MQFLKSYCFLFSFLFSNCVSQGSCPIQIPPNLANVTFNKFGIPIIDGTSIEQVFKTVGYLYARDRLWQLFLTAEVANGRLSALIGPDGINSDAFQLQIKYTDPELDAQFDEFTCNAKKVYSAWVAGIQQRISEVNLNPSLIPLEMQELGVTSVPLYTRNELLTTTLYQEIQYSGGTLPVIQFANLTLLGALVSVYGPADGFAMFNDFIAPADFKVKDTVLPNTVCGNPSAPLCTSANSRNASLKEKYEKLDVADLQKKAALGQEFLDRYRQAFKTLVAIGALPRLGSFGVALSKEKSRTGNPLLLGATQGFFNFPDESYQYNIASPAIDLQAHVFSFVSTPVAIAGAADKHAYTWQTGHLPTQTFLFEPFTNAVFNRVEVIKVKGSSDIPLPIYRSTSLGFVLSLIDPNNPPAIIVTLQDVFINQQLRSFNFSVELLLKNSLSDIITASQNPLFNSDANSRHLQYIDTEGNIAALHLGRWVDYNAIPGADHRLPFDATGFIVPNPYPGTPALQAQIKSALSDVNNEQGYYVSWNTIYQEGLPFNRAQILQFFTAELQRSYWITDYVRCHNKLGLKGLEDLLFYIGKANGGSGQGLIFLDALPDFDVDYPNFVADVFNPLYRTSFFDAVKQNPTQARLEAIQFLESYTGEWILGDRAQAIATPNISNQWTLANVWFYFVFNAIFGPYSIDGIVYPDFVPTPGNLFPIEVDLNVSVAYMTLGEMLLLARLLDSSPCNNPVFFDWLGSNDINQIIVESLDQALEVLGGITNKEHFGDGLRPTTHYKDYVLGTVHEQPAFNQATHIFIAEAAPCGIINMKGLTPQGQDGAVFGTAENPVFGEHAFDQSPCYQIFRPLRLPRFTRS